jgi:hypothetical protein
MARVAYKLTPGAVGSCDRGGIQPGRQEIADVFIVGVTIFSFVTWRIHNITRLPLQTHYWYKDQGDARVI